MYPHIESSVIIAPTEMLDASFVHMMNCRDTKLLPTATTTLSSSFFIFHFQEWTMYIHLCFPYHVILHLLLAFSLACNASRAYFF